MMTGDGSPAGGMASAPSGGTAVGRTGVAVMTTGCSGTGVNEGSGVAVSVAVFWIAAGWLPSPPPDGAPGAAGVSPCRALNSSNAPPNKTAISSAAINVGARRGHGSGPHHVRWMVRVVSTLMSSISLSSCVGGPQVGSSLLRPLRDIAPAL